jgi:hypothetical protein
MVLANLASQSCTKSKIIGVLNNESPLTAKQVYNRITKQGISVRYHKVYENIRDMISLGILVKEDMSYSLSDKWVMDTSVTMERIKVRQIVRRVDTTKEKNGISSMIFDSYKDYVRFIRNYDKYFIENVNPNENNMICWLAYHASRPILNTAQNMEFAKIMKKRNITFSVAICGNTVLDKISKTIFESCGLKNVTLGVPNRFGMSIAIYNDIAICSIFNDKFTKDRNKIYEESNDIKENSHEVSKCISKVADFIDSTNTSVTVMIVKNSDVVNLYKNYILSFFENDESTRSESS